MVKNCILILMLVFGSSFCNPNDILRKCKKTDEACIQKSAQHALVKIFAGVPDLNVETSDPLEVGVAQGDLSTLKYTFSDTVVSGFRNCKIHNVKFNLDAPLLQCNLTCPDVDVKAHYKIDGQLIILPVQGEGPAHIEIKRYEISILAEPKIFVGKDGKSHMMIKKYQVYGDTQVGVKYDLQNLFGGRKELGDVVLRFANSSWKEVADFVQGPILSQLIKKLVGNVNKFFKAVPVEDLFSE